jgi:hypothetical protein
MTAIPGSAAHLSAAGAVLLSLLVAGADLDALVNGVDDLHEVKASRRFHPGVRCRRDQSALASARILHRGAR